MDMVSFRDLYGFLTAEKEAEIRALKAASGARDVDRANAEAELFATKDPGDDHAGAGAGTRTVTADATPGVPTVTGEGLGGRLERDDLASRVYDPKELASGVVLNAAVILEDPRRMGETIAAIEAAGKAAGLPLEAISWQKASGLVGQFVTLARAVLYTAVFIIFMVALVIINNALVMATLQRVPEIGTLRAIGAQRRFVLAMLVLEAMVVGVLFGALGAAAGGGIVAVIGKVGIPAPNEVAHFFFSGPRLYPTLGTLNVAVALGIVLVVSALSALLFHWRILPAIVRGVSRLLERSMRVGGVVGLSTAANVFVGMVEAPLVIRPYLARVSRGELFAIMVGGMASIAGTVLFLYASILGKVLPDGGAEA
jgi:hypothetical protein